MINAVHAPRHSFHVPWLAATALCACSFDVGGLATRGDGGIDAPERDGAIVADAGPIRDGAADDGAPGPPDGGALDGGPVLGDIAHLPPAAEYAGTADLVIDHLVFLDTDTLTIDAVAPPAGITFAVSDQVPSGPDLAVLHVASLDITATGDLAAYGGRPLVIVASGAITIAGALDASAFRDVPGPGGAGSSLGDGAGADGIHGGAWRDSGGGGGSFGGPGARGGDATCGVIVDCDDTAGGQPGVLHGDEVLTSLVGGGGGGDAHDISSCAQDRGGAGGGAVQLYSAVSIGVATGGVIDSGGGGGGGGSHCYNNYGGGTGGGSGGAIYLQAPDIDVLGAVVANGGGGGGSSGDVTAGGPGDDGGPGGAAAGGPEGTVSFAQPGGAGAPRDAAAVPGGDDATGNGNGGGGGGGVGRIVIRYQTSVSETATVSQAPNLATY